MLHGFSFLPQKMVPPDLWQSRPTSLSYKLGRTHPAWRPCCCWPGPWCSVPAACRGSPGTTPSSLPCHGLGLAWPESRQREVSKFKYHKKTKTKWASWLIMKFSHHTSPSLLMYDCDIIHWFVYNHFVALSLAFRPSPLWFLIALYKMGGGTDWQGCSDFSITR